MGQPGGYAHRAGVKLKAGQRIGAKFPPEEFHIRIYQQLGSMRGVKDSTAELVSVTPSALSTLTQYYWIEKIDLTR